MITIYGSDGTVKCKIEPGSSSQQDKVLQGDNVLSLSFTHYAFLELDVNDWCDFAGERYWLMEKYLPKEKNKGEWQYDVKLYGIESLVKRFLVLNNTDGQNEAVFTLTAPALDHVRLIVECINNGMDNTTNWKVGEVVETANLTIDYEGTYCDEALKKVAEAAETEWWVEGSTVNVSRCEHGEELTLRYGESLTGLERDEADNVKFYTRLFPIGSSRNIDAEKYGYSRLQLPEGKKYVDMDDLVSKYGVIHHYEQEAFSGIYPRRVGTVGSVRQEETKDTDGNPFVIYYFKDDGLTFDPNDYEIAGLVKHVVFESGELAGRDFEVNYDSKTKDFEIITTWPYEDDTQLPGGNLVPKAGDQYILWNIRMPDEYYTLAEQEFEAAVAQYNAKHCVDASVYKAPTNPKWVERTGAGLYVGRRVRLESAEFFPETGYRSSRITRVTRKVEDPAQMDLEISDALGTGTMAKIEDSIDDAKNYTGSVVGALNVPDVIRSWDTTAATDTNIYSARRSHQEFLSKKRADRAKKRITFDEGIGLGDFKAGEQGGELDGKGNGELLSLIVRTFLRDPNFQSGFTGKGWKLWMEDGLSRLEIDRLTVRQIMTVFELVIDRIRAVGGKIVVSAANGKIKTVEDTGEAYRLTFEDGNYFEAHDLLRCQVRFTGNDIRSYWVEVASVDGDSVTIAKSEFAESDTSNTTPQVGDEVVLFGNTENADRQNLISISATEDGQPRIDILDGVKAKSYADTLRTRLGNLDGISDPWFGDNQPHGNGLYADNAYLRGTFLLSTGEDVKTRFEAVEGKIASSVEALRQDFVEDRGFLSNATFGDGLSKWQTESNTIFWLGGGKWIWANGAALSKKGDGATLMSDDGRIVVRLRNGYIVQKLANMRSVPSFAENSEGEKEPCAVYVSFMYRCTKAGVLKVGFEGVEKTGFVNFNSLEVEEDIAVTDGYRQWTGSGLWNGTGNFKLSFTGEMMLYLVVLSTDRVEALTYKYRTLLEQSEKLVRIAAQHFDQDGNVLSESGIMVKASGSGIYAQTEDGKLALIGVAVTETDTEGKQKTVIKLTADNIQLEGLVTANGYFKILEDGSIEAVNGKFGGEINATSGKIGGFTIKENSIETDEDGVLKIGGDDFNTRFGTTTGTKTVLVQGGIGQSIPAEYSFAYKENNRLTVRNTGTGKYDWLHILVANVMDIDYYKSTGNTASARNRYGYQFAMVGSGHVVQDGIVEGMCLDVIDNYTANNQYLLIQPPMWCNRICVNSGDYTNCIVILPDKYSLWSCMGCGFLTTETSKKFSFKIDIINTGSKTMYVAGWNSSKVSSGEKVFENTDFPKVYKNGSQGTDMTDFALGSNKVMSLLLVYDGTNYKAFILNS